MDSMLLLQRLNLIQVVAILFAKHHLFLSSAYKLHGSGHYSWLPHRPVRFTGPLSPFRLASFPRPPTSLLFSALATSSTTNMSSSSPSLPLSSSHTMSDDTINVTYGNNTVNTTTTTNATTTATQSLYIGGGNDDDTIYVNGIQLPRLKYGYRTVGFTWEELIKIIQVDYNLDLLSRSVQQQYRYELFRQDLKEQWESTYDYILHSKFGFEKRRRRPQNKDGNGEQGGQDLDSSRGNNTHNDIPANTNTSTTRTKGDVKPSVRDNTSKWVAHPRLEDMGGETRKVLVPNDFPYYMQPGIVHYVLWKTSVNITEDEIQHAQVELQTRLNATDVLFWMNPPHLQSLPDIYHVHFLCRLGRDDNGNCIDQEEG